MINTDEWQMENWLLGMSLHPRMAYTTSTEVDMLEEELSMFLKNVILSPKTKSNIIHDCPAYQIENSDCVVQR